MKISDCPQGSEKWHQLRDLRMTASKAQAIAANGKGLDTYIHSIMQKHYSMAEDEHFSSKSMQRGLDLEDSAVFAYECETLLITEKVGFVFYGDYAGCSPDRLVGDDGLAEIKCLEDKAYFDYMLSEKIDTGYEWQVQMQMMICKREWCDYVVYNPNFKKSLIIKRVLPDKEKYKKILIGLQSGEKKIIEIQKQFKGEL